MNMYPTKTELKKRANTRKVIQKTIIYSILGIISAYMMFVYLFMLLRSLMPASDCIVTPIKFFPTYLSIDGYIALFMQRNYLLYTWNTLKIVLFNIIAGPLSCSICAYGFAKLDVPFKKILFGFVIATVMIPGAITQVPVYVLFARLGWTETLFPLTIPSIFGGGAINMFLLIQYMRGIPVEFEKAAQIDGAKVFQRYLYIVMPLCKPMIIFLMLGAFNSGWGDFYGPLIYLKTEQQYTLALAIYYDSITSNISNIYANLRMAAGVFITMPLIVVFFLYQDILIEGISAGALKG